MKVLFYRRANHESVKGGDLIQLESTAAALERLGVEVVFSSDAQLDLSPFDLVHLFNSPRFEETISFLANAQRQDKPIACSTIYWSKDELGVGVADSAKVRLAKRYLGVAISVRLWRLLKLADRLRSGGSYRLEHRLFRESTMLLPNSEGEMREIKRNFTTARPYHSVRNAIDSSRYHEEPSVTRKEVVLSVGRIENRKNTLALIEACHQAGLHLVLIGGTEENHPYNRRCHELIEKYGFEYLGLMPPEKIVPYYYSSKIHAMASWYETPGLASMEAACGGCEIVTTDRGSTVEYFGDLAHYCDPFSVPSIVAALQRARAVTKPSFALRELILREDTWDKTGEDTLAAYREVLS